MKTTRLGGRLAPLARRAITPFKMIGRATAAAIFRAHSVKSMTHYWDVFTSCFVAMLDRLMSRVDNVPCSMKG